ncbi:hypothetical protein [Rhizobacter sp. SG703]|uniref:hypothetical protein n=1 Tax=Rhizobacter sp. SG703 TaxID=2587140 RepID=UPI001446BA58|nr:hypothetical protein [Rhizobacter sp. SG703]NKI96665.1 hypothetical protein [Rhizobacter sp. SG703]
MAKALPPPARGARRTVIAASVEPAVQTDVHTDAQTQQWGSHNPPSTDAITQLLLAVLTKAKQQITTSTGLDGPALDVALRFQTLSAQLATLADPVGVRNLP